MSVLIREKIHNLLLSYPAYDANYVIKKIKCYPCVSFDLFDTLIKRNVQNPADVFDLLGKRYNDETFRSKRMDAEKKARAMACRLGVQEVTMETIYQQMPAPYCNDSITWIERECAEELKQCYRNEALYEAYVWCLHNGKKIIINTDIYLPKSTIVRILSKCGYDHYDYLLVSSDTGVKKKTGDSFLFMLKECDIKPSDMVHIGDSFKSDFIMARQCGIKPVLIARKNHGATKFCSMRGIEASEKEQYLLLKKFLEDHISEKWSLYYQYGYETLGLLLYGFSRWLLEEVKEKGLRKIFFFSRDGYIMQKAFNICSQGQVENSYFYVSRRSLRVPRLWMNPDLGRVVDSFPFSTLLTIRDFFENIGLNYEDYQQIAEKYGFQYDDTFKRGEIIHHRALNELYAEIKADMISNSKKEYNLLIKYIKQNGFEGNIAVVDIGWHGSLQYYMSEIIHTGGINAQMDGYYIALSKDLRKGIRTNGYVQNSPTDQSCDWWQGFTGIIESVFLAHEGSTKTYQADRDGMIVPVLYPYEYIVSGQQEPEMQWVQQIQAGALQFVQDIVNTQPDLYNYNGRTAFANMCNSCNYPKKQILDLFCKFRFLDVEFKYLANAKSLSYYILHLKEFKDDFYYSKWKIGFLKKMIRIPLPYKLIYETIKRKVS